MKKETSDFIRFIKGIIFLMVAFLTTNISANICKKIDFIPDLGISLIALITFFITLITLVNCFDKQ